MWLDRCLGDREHVGSAGTLGEPSDTAEEELDCLDDEPTDEHNESPQWPGKESHRSDVVQIPIVSLPDFRGRELSRKLTGHDSVVQPTTEEAKCAPRYYNDADLQHGHEIVVTHVLTPLEKDR